jgi:hypothetical protein
MEVKTKNKKTVPILDEDKATSLSLAAIEMIEKKTYPFDRSLEQVFPDAIIPEGIVRGSREHALYQFHGCVLDSGRRAELVYQAARRLAVEVGDLTRLHELPRERIEGILAQEFGIPSHKDKSIFDSAGVLINNSRLLAQEYDSDPRNLIEPNPWDMLKNVTRFENYGRGKAALFIKNCTRFGITQYSHDEIPIKVDRHIMRMCFSHGIIAPSSYNDCLPSGNAKALMEGIKTAVNLGYFTRQDVDEGRICAVRSERYILPLMKLFNKITKQRGISAIDLDDGLWAIGSFLCNDNYYDTCHNNCRIECPFRPPSDNNGTWFFVNRDGKPIEKRKEVCQYLPFPKGSLGTLRSYDPRNKPQAPEKKVVVVDDSKQLKLF